MGVLRTIAIGFLVFLLTINVVAANAAVATERTALNPGFVKTSLQEEGAYDTVRGMVVDAVREEMATSAPIEELPVSVEDVVARAVTEEYLEGQVEANVDSTLTYLHGNREELEMTVDLAPLREGSGAAVSDAIQNMTVEELIGLATSEGGSDLTVSAQGFSFDLAVVGEMAESEAAYDEAREAFRDDLREMVIDDIVEGTFQSASNDELLALVVEDYDPRDYTESEKENMVENREGEIRNELRTRIVEEEGDRIDEEIDDNISQLSDEFVAEVESAVEDDAGVENASVVEPIGDMMVVGIRGLTTDMTYEEYRDGMERSKGNLAENTSAFLVASMAGEMPDSVDLMGELDSGSREQFESARQAVTWFDRIAVALPILAIVLVGAIYVVSRSLVTTAFGAGSGLLIAGLSGVVVARQVPAVIGSAVSSADDGQLGPVVELALGVVERIVGVLGTQSIAIAALGVISIAAGAYVRTYGLPEWTDRGEDEEIATQ